MALTVILSLIINIENWLVFSIPRGHIVEKFIRTLRQTQRLSLRLTHFHWLDNFLTSSFSMAYKGKR